MRYLTPIAAVAVIAFLYSTAYADIDGRCKSEWPEDYRMQRHCQQKQRQAKRWIGKLQNRYLSGTEEREIVGRCASEWSDEHGYDWRMVKYCSKKQIKAYYEVREGQPELPSEDQQI